MIIKSILDTDLYKFTTSYAYMKLFPYAIGTFSFKDRNETRYTTEFLNTLKHEIQELSKIRLTQEEMDFMTSHCRFLPRLYWEWLSAFEFDPNKIEIYLDEEQHLHLEVTDALYKATLYEVPLLAIVSETYNHFKDHHPDKESVVARLKEKVALSNQYQLRFSEFGTRRRFSYVVQETVIEYLKQNALYCSGTSNCYLAMKYDLLPLGTHPHEWFMFHGAQFGYKNANYMALENWVNVYDGDLGTALSDTYTSKVFLSNISRKQAKLFDGIRCDSGDEFEFTDNLIARYKELGVDPTSKIIIFSNALDFPKAQKIQTYCQGKIKCTFGIGTNLTNDTGYQPANIVMKLSQCKMNENKEWCECVKLSDDMGKHMGSAEEVAACVYALHLPSALTCAD